MLAQTEAIRVRPLKRTEYEKLVRAGAFVDEKLELLEGALVHMSPQENPHASTVERLNRILMAKLDLQQLASVRIQLPFAATPDSEPEPDVLVSEWVEERTKHPSTAFLVIEVADDSVLKDRTKARIYARAKVPEYWIVNLKTHVIEVHTEPKGSDYRKVSIFKAGEQLALVKFPKVSVDVGAILPKRR